MKIGICGAGVAGPTLAWWLLRAGHEPTLIERSPDFRTGGYIIDFWGLGYAVAERMGLIEPIRGRGYQVREVRLVRDDGSRAGGFSADVFRRMTGDRFTSLARSDLASTIFEAVEGRVETVFGTSIAAVSDTGDAVDVRLGNGTDRRFDLLVGADGLHSRVRHLVWGGQDRFERRLGYFVAAFEAKGYPRRDEDVYVTYAEPGRSLSRFSLRDDRTLFLLVFSAAALSAPEPDDDTSRRGALKAVFGASGWEAPNILGALDDAKDLYFDRVSQIEVPAWSRGRSVLIGDAAACPSLLAGEGTGLAITEAYVLAGELERAGGDVPAALLAYEARLRRFVARKQASARAFAGSFAPKTALGIWLRQAATRLLVIPPVADLLIGTSVKDRLELPDYAWH